MSAIISNNNENDSLVHVERTENRICIKEEAKNAKREDSIISTIFCVAGRQMCLFICGAAFFCLQRPLCRN